MADDNATNLNDSGSFGWAVLGFFIPLAGLILFFVWKNDRPKSAKMALLASCQHCSKRPVGARSRRYRRDVSSR